MNIFFLDKNPKIAAQYNCDKHVIKIPLEIIQMAEIAHGKNNRWKNHPMTKWVCLSVDNYRWAISHGIYLLDEYKLRYNRDHACYGKMVDLLKNTPSLLTGLTDPPQCMPEYCRLPNYVDAYRNYYVREKLYFAKWKLGNTPEWIKKHLWFGAS